jgi:hypothetical protein
MLREEKGTKSLAAAVDMVASRDSSGSMFYVKMKLAGTSGASGDVEQHEKAGSGFQPGFCQIDAAFRAREKAT